MADPIVNFFSSTLVGTYSNVETSMTIANGSGDLLPDPSVDGEFNLVIYNESAIGVVTTYDGGSTDTRQDLADTNPEIVRVTARSGDVLTVTRGQEGTTASAKEAGNTYRVILSATKKIFDDIQTAIDNVNVTNLTGVESLVFDTTGDEEFGLPAGTTAQRPASPSAGYMRFNTDTTRVEVYDGSIFRQIDYFSVDRSLGVATATVTANDAVAENIVLEVEYLVIAGGGGGGSTAGGGGGAGGYRSSVTGESSGGGASAESVLELDVSTNYTVTVGAGGSGGTGASNDATNGSNSVFSTITSTAGGSGGGTGSNGSSGGSGGGSGEGINLGGAGTANQGFSGGDGASSGSAGAGGGGASQAGVDATSTSGGDGGDGVSSSITGSSVTRAGGGGGANHTGATVGSGGEGGGGDAGLFGSSDPGTSGSANTGGGGGAGSGETNVTVADGGSGGSGVVILRYSSSFSITIGAGLTGSETTVGANKVATITAGTGNVSWS